MKTTVFVVDDEAVTAALLAEGLRERGFHAIGMYSAHECLERIKTEPADIVVTDVSMPEMSGIDLCEHLREHQPDVPTIVVTGARDLDVIIAAMRAGAYDLIGKPVKLDALALAVTRAADHQALRREVRRLRELAGQMPLDGIVGSSPAIRETIDLIHRVAESDATVLVVGESGSGKERVARALHDLSARRDQPFVAVNCAAMPAPLLESELFGHLRGAFTDARQARAGLFVQAGAGTMFLDEIGEMPLEMQVKLLRVLQERTVRPLGSDEEVPIAARVVTASNRDLELAVQEKRFREDLYYRINVVAVRVPPLRERRDDILLLAQYFLRRIATRSRKPVRGLSEGAARALVEYDWPGNVRELENCIERAVALCRLDDITIDDLPHKLQEPSTHKLVIAAEEPGELVTLEEMERRYIRRVMLACGNNKTLAARVLGIDRRSLYRRLADLQQPYAGVVAEPEPSGHSEDEP